MTTTGVTQSFTYQQGQSSSLGVGTSDTGAAGSFTSNAGTTSQSSTFTEVYPTYGANTDVYYFTEFVYGLFKIACEARGVQNGPHYLIVYYQTQATSYAGGTQVRFPYGAPTAKYCVPQLANTSAQSDNTTAIEWTDGIVIPVIGLSLSTQTGYSTNAKLSFHFAAAHHICGTGGYPGGTPYQLVAES